jgi:hypothetical protein
MLGLAAEARYTPKVPDAIALTLISSLGGTADDRRENINVGYVDAR